MEPPHASSDATPDVSAFTHAPPAPADSRAALHLPNMIGRYRPLRLLGEGGMGVVYEAEQERPKRVVALKVIRSIAINTSVLRRFEMETEVLGRLQHPGIAQIYEAGTADSGSGPQPFFAMELVRGPRVDRFIADRNPSTRERIELIMKICDAVQYAHTKGVIHRDLKPANILVNEAGDPKVLDFGVARITDADVNATIQPTRTGQVLGTLQYMSPEQARGDIHDVDTSADVYALGVIAYELLGGRPPYVLANRSLIDAVRVICDEEPSRLSTSNRTLRGDLQTVIHKALEKDKRRRYGSSAEFAADLRRCVNSEPITARPPSTIYQLRKFAVRNRAFTTAAIATFLLLTIGLAEASISRNRIRAEQQRTLAQKAEADRQTIEAKNASAQAAAANKFLWTMLKSVNPAEAKGNEPTVRQVLDAAGASVGDELKDQPLVEAGVRYTIGDTYVALGRPDRAEPQLRRALELQQKLRGPDDHGTIVSQNMLAFALQSLGRYSEAEPIARDALARSTRLLSPDHPDTIQTANDLAMLLTHTGKLDEAEMIQRDIFQRQSRRLGSDHADTLYAVLGLTFTMTQQGKDADVAPMLRDALPRLRRVRGDDHPDTLTGIQALGISLLRLNKLPEAEPLLRESLDRRRRVMGADHPDTLETMSMLGVLLSRTGKIEESIALQRDALDQRRKLFGPEHPATLASISRLAQTLSPLPGRAIEAIALLREALAGQRKLRGPDHPNTLRTALTLATLLIENDDRVAAEPIVTEIVDRGAKLGAKHPIAIEAAKLRERLAGTPSISPPRTTQPTTMP